MYSVKYRGTPEYLLIYEALKKAARERGLLTYSEVARTMGLPPSGHHMSREVGQLLGEISQTEHEQGRPMLSALVCSTSGGVGAGFFRLARDLSKLREGEDKAVFLAAEKEAVYSAWSREP